MTKSRSVFTRPARRAIRVWLLVVAALMVVTVVVGGATRLTESGLSIVEWKPVTGVLPPLDEQAWQVEFDKYKAIPQYRERNAGMSLADFKTIYWWEWTHRVLARLVGAVFLLPLLWFLWRGQVEPHLRARLLTIFFLGAALGAVGWWMVASGLSERVSVSQYRLAFHLTLACVIFAAMLWTAQNLVHARAGRRAGRVSARVRWRCSRLVIVQIYLGALVSGLRAGLIYNTWPLIDGSLVPDGARLFFLAPAWRNVFENTLTVQFDHRMVAYAVWLFALLHAADVARTLRGGGVAHVRARAGGGRHPAGCARHRHPAAPGAARARAAASGHGARRARDRGRACGAPRAAARRRGRGDRRRRLAPTRASDMIETTEQAGVAVLRMADGKANAMSIDFCAAVTAKFAADICRRAPWCSPAPGGYFPPASICCDCSTAVADYIREFLPALSTMLAAVFYPSQAGGRGDQRPRDGRRLRARLRRRQAHHGARRRADRRDRAAGRRSVSRRGHGDHAVRDGAAIFRGRDLQRRDLYAAGSGRARPGARYRRPA